LADIRKLHGRMVSGNALGPRKKRIIETIDAIPAPVNEVNDANQESRVLIAMPTMDRLDVLKRTLPALLENTDRNRCDIYVITQGSSIDVCWYVFGTLASEKNCHYIANEENVGYAQALSQAFAFRRPGQHTIHMDDDVMLLEPVVDTLVGFLEYTKDSSNPIGLVNLYGFNTNWKGIERETPYGLFGDTGYVYTTFACMASWVAEVFGAPYQPGLYGEEDLITSKRIQRLGYAVGYWLSEEPKYENLDLNKKDCYLYGFKQKERKQSWRSEADRVGGGHMLDTWNEGGPGGPLYHELPEKDEIPLLF